MADLSPISMLPVAAGVSASTLFAVVTDGTVTQRATGQQVVDFVFGLSPAVSSISALVPEANKLAYYTGDAAAQLTDLSSFGRVLIAGIDAEAARASLGAASLVSPEFTGGLTVVRSPAGLQPTMTTAQSLTGSYSNPLHINRFDITEDDVELSGANFVTGWTFEHHFGAGSGGRQALAVYGRLTAAMDSGSSNRNYCASNFDMTAQSGDGGTGLDVSSSKGAIFGLGAGGHAESGAENLLNLSAAEFNVSVQDGATVYAKSIIQLSGWIPDAVQGSEVDAMIWAYKQTASAVTWRTGILFDYPADTDFFPFDGDSTVLSVGDGTVGWGIDLSAATFVNEAFKSPGFGVDADGRITALAASFASGRVAIKDDANGAFEMGANGVAPFFDMMTTAASDYDVRIQATGGNGTTGQGTLNIKAGLLEVDGAASFSGGKALLGDGGIGFIELGGVSVNPFIDFHSSSSSNDYDVRMQVSGGNGSSGNGVLTVSAGSVVLPDTTTGAITSHAVSMIGAFNFGVDAQANDSYVVTLSPAATSYRDGMVVYFKANTANTGAATINVNGLGARTIVKRVSTTLANNDIIAGMYCHIVYNNGGSVFVLMNPRTL